MNQSQKASERKSMRDLARWAYRLHTGRLCVVDLIRNTSEILDQLRLYAEEKIHEGPNLLVDAERKKFIDHHPITKLLAYKIQRTASDTSDGIRSVEIAVQHIAEIL